MISSFECTTHLEMVLAFFWVTTQADHLFPYCQIDVALGNQLIGVKIFLHETVSKTTTKLSSL